MAVGQFRSYVWDPVLLISQIIGVQSLFYSGLGVWQLLINSLTHRPISVQQLFETSEADFVSKLGRIQLSIFLLNSLTCAISLWLVVQRAKQCLDFAVTAHFIHFICSCFMIGFPVSWVWWIKNVISIAVTTVFSEYLCMKYEMKAIPVAAGGVS